MRVRLSEDRSWPTRPAEWNVEPLVSWSRSTSTASLQPSRASQYKMEQPPTPPPTTTTCARPIIVSSPSSVRDGRRPSTRLRRGVDGTFGWEIEVRDRGQWRRKHLYHGAAGRCRPVGRHPGAEGGNHGGAREGA